MGFSTKCDKMRVNKWMRISEWVSEWACMSEWEWGSEWVSENEWEEERGIESVRILECLSEGRFGLKCGPSHLNVERFFIHLSFLFFSVQLIRMSDLLTHTYCTANSHQLFLKCWRTGHINQVLSPCHRVHVQRPQSFIPHFIWCHTCSPWLHLSLTLDSSSTETSGLFCFSSHSLLFSILPCTAWAWIIHSISMNVFVFEGAPLPLLGAYYVFTFFFSSFIFHSWSYDDVNHLC